MVFKSIVNHHTLYLPSLTTLGACLLGQYKRQPLPELPGVLKYTRLCGLSNRPWRSEYQICGIERILPVKLL